MIRIGVVLVNILAVLTGADEPGIFAIAICFTHMRYFREHNDIVRGAFAGTMNAIARDIGIILVDHGSKYQEANETLLEVVKMYRAVSGTEIVEPAHMELAAPTIAEALARCVARGAKTVVVHPYFLSPGRHSTGDIPRLAAEAAASHPEVEVKVTQPLNVDEAIGPIIQARILACLRNEE